MACAGTVQSDALGSGAVKGRYSSELTGGPSQERSKDSDGAMVGAVVGYGIGGIGGAVVGTIVGSVLDD